MGVHCEINLFKPADGAFVPGGIVAGVIKYAVDEETTFKQIIVSIKGNGFLRIKDNARKRREQRFVTRNSEEYVDIDNVIQPDEKTLPVGLYETNFSFQLPHNIPPTFVYDQYIPRYHIRCYIGYYVRIKFEKPGMFSFNKHFKKGITVVPAITPTLPTVPTLFGEENKLFQLFTSKTSVVHIKANVESCVVAPGGKIEMNYEVFNDTNVVVKGVEIKLKEIVKFTPKGHIDVKTSDHVPDTDTKTPSINCGDTQKMLIVMNVPSDRGTIQNSNLISREYIAKITVELPTPHFNAALEIPIQIGGIVDGNAQGFDDPPPSYWEVMGEEDENKEEKDDDSE